MSNTQHVKCHGGVPRTVREFHIVWRVVTLYINFCMHVTFEIVLIVNFSYLLTSSRQHTNISLFEFEYHKYHELHKCATEVLTVLNFCHCLHAVSLFVCEYVNKSVTDKDLITLPLNKEGTMIYSEQRRQSSYSSSRMRVMNHDWSARKQRLHLQSVAGISRHSALSEDRIRQCGTSSGSRCKDTDQCLQVAVSFCRQRSVPVPCENGSVETSREDSETQLD